MNPDRVDTERLRALKFWKGPITVEPLAGGITNRNYRVRSAGTSYVARLCVARERLGIDRRNEVVCQRAAHAMGVAPAVVHHEEGVLISEHLSARTLGPADVREPAFVPRLAAVLRSLHGGWDRLTGEFLYFSAFQTVGTYAATARELGARLPGDLDALLDDARSLARGVAPFVPVLCHNDMLPANVLDDGRRVWLVDWEYAGVGHPLFDLAGVSANCGFSAADDAALLSAYRGTPGADPADLRELRVLKAMSLLREALWSVIQTVASDLAFDYAAYADTNFRAYRAARRGVDREGGAADGGMTDDQ
jgi:thiamine kinase-like enzyme